MTIHGKSGSDRYDVEFSSGKREMVSSNLIHAGILSSILVDYDPEAKEAAEAARRKKEATAAREAHVRLVNSKPWQATIKNAVLEKKIKIGMTPEQVTLAWGRPGQINRSVGSWGINEQWVYGSTYLYFENDKLTSFQDSR